MKKFMMAATVAATALLSACNNSMPGAQMKSTVDTLSYEIGFATIPFPYVVVPRIVPLP